MVGRWPPRCRKGRYAFGNLLPGEYLVGALKSNVMIDITDPARLLDAIIRVATRVTIGENDKRTQDLITR